MLKVINEKLHTPTWLFFLLGAVFILRIPSFFEPYSYGDEMIYLTLGEAVRQGVPLYKGIHDNKPPLLYLTAAVAGNLFWFKAILALSHLITVFLFWKLSEKIFAKNEKSQIVATIVFSVLTTIPLLEGNIVNAELFMIGPIIGAFLMLYQNTSPSIPQLLTTGVLFAVATLFKVPAAFDLLAIFSLWVLTIKNFSSESLLKLIKNSTLVVLGFMLPIALTFGWYYLQGAFTEYLVAAYLQNFGYLSSWRPTDVQKPFLEKNGPLLVRAAVVAVGILILFLKRQKLSKRFLFLTSWLLFALFAAALSERPYPHYLIQIVPPLSFLLTILFTEKTLEQIFVIVPLTLAFFVPVYYKFWYYQTVPYYSRFIKFASGAISKENYLSSFGSATTRNYQVATFVSESTRPGDKIFVWGNDSVIYALAKRLPPTKYVADYHIKDFSRPGEVIASFETNLPKIIVILPGASAFPDLDILIAKNYALAEEIGGANIWKLLSPEIRTLMAP